MGKIDIVHEFKSVCAGNRVMYWGTWEALGRSSLIGAGLEEDSPTCPSAVVSRESDVGVSDPGIQDLGPRPASATLCDFGRVNVPPWTSPVWLESPKSKDSVHFPMSHGALAGGLVNICW